MREFRKAAVAVATRFCSAVPPCFSLLLLCADAFAAGGGKPATKLVNVADTRGMTPGLSLWIADVYNSNMWLFGLTVVVIMAGMGAVLGFGFDKLIGLLGIKLGKLDHHE
jgi:hypothetical protein